MKLKDRLGKHPVLIITTICVICVAVIAGFTAHIELQRYEDGILAVSHTHQEFRMYSLFLTRLILRIIEMMSRLLRKSLRQWMPRLTITGHFQRTSQCYL